MNRNQGRALTGGQGRVNQRDLGVVSGAVLRAVRDDLGLTQADLAEALNVSVDIVAAWEAGRRPMTNMKVSDLHRHRRIMLRMGADQGKLSLIDPAVDVDLIIGDISRVDGPGHLHPLATMVPDRTLTELLAWPLTGQPPRQLRTGKVTRALLGVGEQELLADHLRRAADHATNDETGAMIRRQIHYLLAQHEGSRAWMNDVAERRRNADMRSWTPEWPVQRSHAVAESLHGDPEPLTRFIDEGLATDQGMAANLNYWAYWTGELAGPWTSDREMITTDLHSWSGERLLDSLIDSLLDSPYRDLCAHSLWALVQAKPHLISAKARRTRLLDHIEKVSSIPEVLNPIVRERLGQVAFLARSAA